MSNPELTLQEKLSEIDENELIYIGTKSGSGFFFIGTKNEIPEEMKTCFNRKVTDVYHRTTCPDEYGTVIIIRGGSVRGNFWFHDEFIEANNMLRPFNPVTELRRGRYTLDDKENIGKFNRFYHETRLDYFGNKFALATFSNNDIKLIRQYHLPGGCFLMGESQMRARFEHLFGEKWAKKPQEILKYFNLELYGDAVDGRIAHEGGIVYLATDTVEPDGARKVVQIDGESVTIRRSPANQCVFVPVFFSRIFKDINLMNGHV